MNCEQFMETALKAGGTLPDEAFRHLATCPSCRQYCQTLSLVETARSAPSSEIDEGCLRAGRRQMRLRARIVKWRRTLLGLAAALTVCAGVLTVLRTTADNRNRNPETMAEANDDLLDFVMTTDGAIENVELDMLCMADYY